MSCLLYTLSNDNSEGKYTTYLSIYFLLSIFTTMSCVCYQPAVAVGNVGQLAVDLLVSTLNMSRVGYMHTDCLIPMAGNNPYGTCKENAEELHTPAEG